MVAPVCPRPFFHEMRCRRSLCDCLLLIEFGAPPFDFIRRQSFDVAVVELPVRTVAPAQRRLHGRPRRWRGLEHLQRQIEREGLRGRSFGRPAALPSGKSENSKRGTPTYSTMSLAQPMTTVAMPLASSARREADALVADRAIGHQHHRIDADPAWQRATISGQSTSSVTRWLRLVGRPWKRGASADPARGRRRRSAAAGNSCRDLRRSCAGGRSPICEMRRSCSSAVSPE